MNRELAQQFAEANRAERGVVHFAESDAALGGILHAIFLELAAKEVMMAGLLPVHRASVRAACESLAVPLLEPPFAPDELPQAIARPEIGVTLATFAIARTGTVAHVTTQEVERLISDLCWTQVSLVRQSTILADPVDAAPLLRAQFQRHAGNCTATFVTGPSRTADIELRLIFGVHGPQKTHTIILADS